jgi:hypothetical protein
MLEVRAESDYSTMACVDSLRAESTLFMQFWVMKRNCSLVCVIYPGCSERAKEKTWI